MWSGSCVTVLEEAVCVVVVVVVNVLVVVVYVVGMPTQMYSMELGVFVTLLDSP